MLVCRQTPTPPLPLMWPQFSKHPWDSELLWGFQTRPESTSGLPVREAWRSFLDEQRVATGSPESWSCFAAVLFFSRKAVPVYGRKYGTKNRREGVSTDCRWTLPPGDFSSRIPVPVSGPRPCMWDQSGLGGRAAARTEVRECGIRFAPRRRPAPAAHPSRARARIQPKEEHRRRPKQDQKPHVRFRRSGGPAPRGAHRAPQPPQHSMTEANNAGQGAAHDAHSINPSRIDVSVAVFGSAFRVKAGLLRTGSECTPLRKRAHPCGIVHTMARRRQNARPTTGPGVRW